MSLEQVSFHCSPNPILQKSNAILLLINFFLTVVDWENPAEDNKADADETVEIGHLPPDKEIGRGAEDDREELQRWSDPNGGFRDGKGT